MYKCENCKVHFRMHIILRMKYVDMSKSVTTMKNRRNAQFGNNQVKKKKKSKRQISEKFHHIKGAKLITVKLITIETLLKSLLNEFSTLKISVLFQNSN